MHATIRANGRRQLIQNLCKNYEKDKSDEEERLPVLMEKSGSAT
jgi:hypothetical protein